MRTSTKRHWQDFWEQADDLSLDDVYGTDYRIVAELLARGGMAGKKVLEVGAGTGSLTSNILHLLPKERVDYCFTDISNFFFSRAEQKFADYPFVS